MSDRLGPDPARFRVRSGFDLTAAGTHVVKIALMVSPDERKARFADRLANPSTFWKYNPHDLDDRARRDEFRDAHQAVFDRTDRDLAPWYVIPADRKWFARLAVTEILIAHLEAMELR